MSEQCAQAQSVEIAAVEGLKECGVASSAAMEERARISNERTGHEPLGKER